MGHTLDARGKPTADDAADPVPDLQAAYDWADKVGAGLRGTSAARLLLTAAQIEVGQLFVETDTGAVYKRKASGWDLIWNDTGWQNLPLAAGWSIESGDAPQYRVRAGYLSFRGRIDATTGAPNVPFTTPLPVGARPDRAVPQLIGTTGGSGAMFVMNVGTSGEITIFKGSNAINDIALSGFVPFLLA